MIGYVKCFNGFNENMSFMAKSNGLIEEYNTIWDKVSSLIKRGFDSEPVSGDECAKT